MDPLSRLLGRHESLDERVIGTYLHPHRVFPPIDYDVPYMMTKVIAKAQVDEHEVLVTRYGCLFVRPPKNFPEAWPTDPNKSKKHFERRIAFEEEAAFAFNRLICELALMGIVSGPATPVHISVGKLVDGHALISSGGGGREFYPERTVQPSFELLRGTWPAGHAMHVQEGVLDTACLLERANKLSDLSPTLPTLVAGAYSLSSQRQLGEALIDAWVVSEQILDYLWREHVSKVGDTARKDRLSDPRTYSAAVRTEILHTTDEIDQDLYSALNLARKHRNDMAHRARVTSQAANDVLHAMKLMLEHLLQTEVESPIAGSSISW